MRTELHKADAGHSVVTARVTYFPVSDGRLVLKADALLKHNIDELLRVRRQRRIELSRYCRMSRSWLDKIFSEGRREIPLKYLDRIADFFGIATYQLFQPGISPLTERRRGTDRRAGRDRRLSQAVLSERPGDVDVMQVIRALSRQGRERAIALLADILDDEIRRQPATTTSHAVSGHKDEIDAAAHVPARRARKR